MKRNGTIYLQAIEQVNNPDKELIIIEFYSDEQRYLECLKINSVSAIRVLNDIIGDLLAFKMKQFDVPYSTVEFNDIFSPDFIRGEVISYGSIYDAPLPEARIYELKKVIVESGHLKNVRVRKVQLRGQNYSEIKEY